MGMPRRSATTVTSTRPSASGSGAGRGTHTSSWHAPSGLISQPVISANSSAVRSRRSSVIAKRYRVLLEQLPDQAADLALPAGLRPGDPGRSGNLAFGVRDPDRAFPTEPALVHQSLSR